MCFYQCWANLLEAISIFIKQWCAEIFFSRHTRTSMVRVYRRRKKIRKKNSNVTPKMVLKEATILFFLSSRFYLSRQSVSNISLKKLFFLATLGTSRLTIFEPWFVALYLFMFMQKIHVYLFNVLGTYFFLF